MFDLIPTVTFAALACAAPQQLPLGDLSPGPANSQNLRFGSVGGTTVVRTDDSVTFAQTLWSSDGTAAGTTPLTGSSNFVAQFLPFGDRILAVGQGPLSTPTELEVVDVGAGTITTIASFSYIVEFQAGGSLGDRLVFGADDGASGFEPWVTDGSTGGTQRLADHVVGTNGSGASFFQRIGDEVYYFANDGVSPFSVIWRTDGVTTVQAGVAGFGQVLMAVASGDRLFWIDQEPFWANLWVFDPTTGISTWLGSSTTSFGSTVERLVPFQGGVVFDFDSGNLNREPWFSDGTVLGTGPILELHPTLSSFPVFSDVEVGGRLLFRARDANVTGVFATDGTAAGTSLVLAHDATYTFVSPLRSLGADRALILAYSSPLQRWDLFETDGSAAGTSLLAMDASVPAPGEVNDGKLFFIRDDGLIGLEIWTLAIAPAAVSTGAGCGVGARQPTLEADVPRLGTAFSFAGSDAPVGATGAILVSLVPDSPARLGGGCVSELDAGSAAVLHWFVPTASDWTWSAPLPLVPEFQGLTIAAQAWFGPSTNPSGLETTNGLHMTLGI